MDRVRDYRSQAVACRGMANKEINAGHKSQLLEMARHWDLLAEQREQMLKTRDGGGLK